MDRLWNITDVSQRYGTSKWTIYHWVAKGLIPHLKIGGQLRFRLKDLEAWEEKSLVGSVKVALL